jgi:hypothetical protein
VIEVHVNGQSAGRLAYEAGQEGVLRIEGFEGLLHPGANEVTLFGSGASSMAYTVDIAYRTESPLTDPTTAVDLVTTLDQGRVGMGETVTLRATVTNLTSAGQPMTLARIGIPGGLSAQEWQLRKLRDDGAIDFYETRTGEVDLYWRSLAPGAVERVNLELNATVPGTWTGPASSAYLYYTDDRRDWEQPVTIEVAPPAG